MSFKKCLIFTIFIFCGEVAAKNPAFTIFSVRSPATLFRGNRQNITATRGGSFLPGDQLLVGSRGGVTLDTPLGSTLSVIGPAMLRMDYKAGKVPIIFVDYGDIYVRKTEEDVFDLQGPAFHLSSSSEEAELYYESPMASGFFRIRNIFGEIIVADRSLSEGHVLSKNSDLILDDTKLGEEDLRRSRDRHFNNRQNQELSTVGDEIFDPAKVDTLSGFFEILPWAGTTKFFAVGSTLAQYTGFVGISLKLGTQIYVGLPKEPKRVDFIFSPQVRFGVDVGAYSGNIHFNETNFQSPHLVYANAIIGLGAHGLSVDFLYGLTKMVMGSGATYAIKKIYGLDAQYRIDLKEASGSETGLILGLRALDMPIEEITTTLQTETSLTTSKVHTMNLAPIVGISMRF